MRRASRLGRAGVHLRHTTAINRGYSDLVLGSNPRVPTIFKAAIKRPPYRYVVVKDLISHRTLRYGA